MGIAMSTTRAEVLQALREWGQPITPIGLASFMNRSPQRISTTLTALYARDLADRYPLYAYKNRYVYVAKPLVS